MPDSEEDCTTICYKIASKLYQAIFAYNMLGKES
jgi:hypothetical protein